MKKILLLSIGLLSLQLSAQNVKITLYQNSLKMSDDTLYVKYRIENKTNSILVLYSVESLSVKIHDEYLNSENFDRVAHPRLWAIIQDSKNEYAKIWMRFVLRDRFPPDSISPSYSPSPPIKYLVLQPFQSIEQENFLILHSMKLYEDSLFVSKTEPSVLYNFVSDGVNTFQLEYFSGSAFRSKFRKDKQRDNRLKNSVMFEGIIKSNVCTFSYPHDYKESEKEQLNNEKLKDLAQDKFTSYPQYLKWVKYLCVVVLIVLLIMLLYKIKRRL